MRAAMIMKRLDRGLNDHRMISRLKDFQRLTTSCTVDEMLDHLVEHDPMERARLHPEREGLSNQERQDLHDMAKRAVEEYMMEGGDETSNVSEAGEAHVVKVDKGPVGTMSHRQRRASGWRKRPGARGRGSNDSTGPGRAGPLGSGDHSANVPTAEHALNAVNIRYNGYYQCSDNELSLEDMHETVGHGRPPASTCHACERRGYWAQECNRGLVTCVTCYGTMSAEGDCLMCGVGEMTGEYDCAEYSGTGSGN